MGRARRYAHAFCCCLWCCFPEGHRRHCPWLRGRWRSSSLHLLHSLYSLRLPILFDLRLHALSLSPLRSSPLSLLLLLHLCPARSLALDPSRHSPSLSLRSLIGCSSSMPMSLCSSSVFLPTCTCSCTCARTCARTCACACTCSCACTCACGCPSARACLPACGCLLSLTCPPS